MPKNIKLLIGALLAIVFIVLVISTLFKTNRSISPSPIATSVPTASIPKIIIPTFLPFPTQIPTPSPIPSNIKLNKQTLITSTPVQTPEFDIEYYSESDSFRITIKINPYFENKAKAEKWLIDRGLKPADLNIKWAAYKYVQ